MKSNDTNKKLLHAFQEWEKQSHFYSIAEANNLSRPYVCSITDRYANADKRILIIGQETKDFPRYDYSWSEEEIQQWGCEYIEKQLWNLGKQKYNHSGFWKMFRYIEREFGFCPCWNNVDKAHQIIDGKTVPLSYELEYSLNSVTLSNGKTLLKEEIGFVEPDIVLFITGPYYSESMAAALQIDADELRTHTPTAHALCTDISETVNMNIQVLWTYHPTYLNLNEKNNQLFTKTMDEIQKKIM